jgi:formylglycine-generating enzyme required for sulfatase activity
VLGRFRRGGIVVGLSALAIVAVARGQAAPEEETPDEDLPPLASASASPSASAPVVDTPMARIPGGTFRMGSQAPRAQPNETPLHLVTVSPFQLDVTEVTVADYRACVARGACVAPSKTSTHCTYDREGELPINCVSFADADAFCRVSGKRLPTESEWELAARGTGVEHAYPWGDDPPSCERAISMRGEHTAEGCSTGGPAPVDRRRGRSPYGVADLAGNVEEWVSDFYDDRYPEASVTGLVDPRGPQLGTAHVLRGGGWQSARSGLRTTARSWASAFERGTNVGFRCARGESVGAPRR